MYVLPIVFLCWALRVALVASLTFFLGGVSMNTYATYVHKRAF